MQKKSNEMETKINTYIHKKKTENNESNKKEFIDQNKYKKEMCSRTCPARINRNQQLKLNIIKNEVGPLDRSVTDNDNDNKNGKSKSKDSQNIDNNGLSERINNIKEHLNIVTPLPPKMYERIKVLEDKIMKIEREFPTWATIHFNQPNKNLNNMDKLT
ncbi:hypothetical protein BCR36DRAFT_180491 [Piromyces finnis]|uniref:Uncharacterized protein n=1 Tax=Piromyces finnis TaxID=1754191 RepID=A0A1Y1UV69_9FUNG|nr:hypothetical protein BCR36DRAFT_180491 [Piromyces finnis]|eukprot:ORX41518.1 hypothetical protein BCR36DRAFT_180491 [Piromyces finnis]